MGDLGFKTLVGTVADPPHTGVYSHALVAHVCKHLLDDDSCGLGVI